MALPLGQRVRAGASGSVWHPAATTWGLVVAVAGSAHLMAGKARSG